MAVAETIDIVDPEIQARNAARKQKLMSAVVPLATAAGLVALWQLGVKGFGVPTYIAPAPSDVAATFVEKFPLLMQNFWPTFIESVAGFAVGNLAAILIAVAFVHSRNVERAFFPIAVFVNTIPILAIAPILVLIFGPGMTAKVVIAALICFFPTLVNMVRGLQSVSPQTLELARILSASKSEVFWKMRLPSSLPFLFSALKISATTSVIGAIVGEWVGADLGLGALIIDATFNFNSPLLYATVLMSSGLSVLMFTLVSLAERRIVRWQPKGLQEKEKSTSQAWTRRGVTGGVCPMTERNKDFIDSRAEQVPVVSDTDVVVIGAGPAGLSAAVSAARNGARVTLVERYHHLGGMASGGMVLVLDDMVNDGTEIVTTGIVSEFVDRMQRQDGAVFPPPEDCLTNWEMWQKWSRWGCIDFHKQGMPQPIIHAVAFDPDAWKRVSLDLVQEAKIELRTHSWFSEALVEGSRVTGVIVQTKLGRQAIRARMVIDASGDLDVASSAGASFVTGQFIVTTVFRLMDVDTAKAEAFEYQNPEAYKALDRQARRVIGGAWGMWWLKTPLPGVVWCNCPHMPGYDGMSPEHMVEAEFEGRRRMMALLDFARANLPGFENARMLGAAEQMGIRQTRLLQGEYIVTKDDVKKRRHFADSVCRGRDYYTPYRALLPKGIDNLIVAGRHYSVESEAQKQSREIPPCMAQGEAAGVAVAKALQADCALRDVDVTAIQKQMRAQGADPGDVPSANALIEETAAA